jgi:hypothetical protein
MNSVMNGAKNAMLGRRGVLAAAVLVCGAGAASAAESVTIGLTGVQIRNATNQSRSSAPATIDPANNYTVTYSADTRVRGRGEGGFVVYILPTLFPSPVTLDQLVQTLTGDPAADFPETSEAPNPGGTHPAVLINDTLAGTASQSGVTLTFSATLNAQIGSDNIASFNITDVVLTPSTGLIRTGYLEFTSGSITITRNPIVGPTCDSIDFNNDGSVFDPTDVDAFLSVFSEGPCIPAGANCNDVDFNNDTSVFDPCDVDAFLLRFSEGPCTLCGV